MNGWTCERYSLTFERVVEPAPQDEQTGPVGTVVKVDQVLSDDWLGPIDQNIEAYGENPRMLFGGKVGSCPSGALAGGSREALACRRLCDRRASVRRDPRRRYGPQYVASAPFASVLVAIPSGRVYVSFVTPGALSMMI